MRGNKRQRRKVAPDLKVLLVADTHGSVDAEIAARARRCNVVVHAGDIGAAHVLQQLRPSRGKLYAVGGNNDTPAKWPRHDRALLERIPREHRLTLPGGVLIAVHGDQIRPASSRHRRLRALYPTARLVVYGHTHRIVCDQTDVPWIVNPGAGGRVRTYGGASCLILRASKRRWRLEIYPKDRVLPDISEKEPAR